MSQVKLRVLFAALGACACVVVANPVPGHAQARVEITPYAGSYYAIAGLGLAVPDVEERHENVPVVGAALTARITRLLGVEGSFAYAPSGTNISSATQPNRALSGYIIYGSARFRFQVPRSNLYGLAGVGIVRRGGETWDFPGLDNLTDIAGVIGLGVRAAVTPAVAIDVKAEGHFYSFDADELATGDVYESKVLQEILVTVGIPIPLVRG